MVVPLLREVEVYEAVRSGELRIDSQGRIWRVAARRGTRWTPGTRVISCEPRRAENSAGKYLQVRVMFDGTRFHAMAHRLVWLHFEGSIPAGLTINHKNGIWTDNRPINLEIATYSEQQMHALHVLRRGRVNQYGTRNSMAKLTSEQVAEIQARRAAGELLESIARDYDVRMQQISRIARGERRSRG